MCGCGCSASLILGYVGRKDVCTIGVNDIGELFTPDFLLCVDPPLAFNEKRRKTIENTNSKHYVTQSKLWHKENTIYIEIAGIGITEIDSLGKNNKFNKSCISPYIAIILAFYLGYKEIGLIGVDFTDNHYNSNDGRHNLSNRLYEIEKDLKNLSRKLNEYGVKIFNLSENSKITSIEKMKIDEFYEK